MVDRAVLLAGGWAHQPEDAVAAVGDLINPRRYTLDVVTDPAAATPALEKDCDLLIVSACWFSMLDDRYTPEQRRESSVPRDAVREALLDGLRHSGCPVLAMHTAVICFDDWQPWGEWLGGTWNWSTSWHPNPTALDVNPAERSPISFDPFTVIDEEYQGLDVDRSVSVVARSAAGHPLVWIHQSSLGRAAVNLLGHDARSLGHPAHRALNSELLDWLV